MAGDRIGCSASDGNRGCRRLARTNDSTGWPVCQRCAENHYKWLQSCARLDGRRVAWMIGYAIARAALDGEGTDG